MANLTLGAKELDAASRGDRKDAATRLKINTSTLYRWCNGSAIPPGPQQGVVFDVFGIDSQKWTIVVGDDGEPEVPRDLARSDDTPSPLQLWKDAHAWRLDLQRRAGTATAVAAAFKAEQAALVLVTGDAQRYADLQRITAEVLKAWPDALAALKAALAEAEL